jgi:hypothetical protein
MTELPQADPWHPTKADELELEGIFASDDMATTDLQSFSQISAIVFRAPSSITTAREVVAIRDWQPSFIYGIAQETLNYMLLQDQGIAAKFLGHITENGTRVIGFLLEHVSAREAGIGDLQACKTVLSKLHKLGIGYGTLKRHSFLILADGTALLQGFFTCTANPDTFDRELQDVEQVLKEESTTESKVFDEELSKKMDRVPSTRLYTSVRSLAGAHPWSDRHFS